MHLHRKEQNAMNSREIIENLLLFDRKKATLNEYQRNHRASNASLQFLSTKFHDMVSQGPVYVCTCCDQSWYKHSVLHADKL